MPYVKNTDIFLCPSRSDQVWNGRTRRRKGYAVSGPALHEGAAPQGRKLSDILEPASVIMLVETKIPCSDIGDWCIMCYGRHLQSDGTGFRPDGTTWGGCPAVHNELANWAFFDGHVKSLRIERTKRPRDLWRQGIRGLGPWYGDF